MESEKMEVFQDPGNHKYFICYAGLMDVDKGYFNTKQQAEEEGVEREKS